MTAVPTLAEMRAALGDQQPSSEEGGVPTLAEMMHANELYQSDPDAYLEHYGIKGMKWGIRRPREVLARLTGKKSNTDLKDEEGDVVGGIRAKTRAGAQKLKDMRNGETLILEDAHGASKVMAKQKDGTFKEVYLSADAERVLRTTKKDQSEMSDKEINDALNRAKKIEEYNKLFNPQPNPNADLETRVKAMQLELQLKQAQAQLNPPKKAMVKRFVDTVQGGFGAYNQINKAMNGKFDPMVKDMLKDLWDQRNDNASSSKTGDVFATKKYERDQRKAAEDRFWSGGDTLRTPDGGTNVSSPRMSDMRVTPEQQRRVDDYVHNITSMGSQDPLSPYYSPPSATSVYPELESRRN